ncbi:protein of unknown function [Duganella sp. CF458]|uniref:DUF349 domain-containing protein n=1 Tax=Duganella sp. CF458 TaxID=1884368 RepID=UPI0008E3A372|nr:DUF349 domain-containing protein [Duganella sp. CF458]SFF94279.1 protein of unknown function [Duganella sp. CF458]
MFEFLFKQQASQASVAGQPSAGGSQAPLGTPAERRAAQAALARNLAGDEAAAVELILNSEFADVRLAAAEHVVSQDALEKVQHAVRNSDRRVAKLVQGRLDAIRHVQAEQKQAQACIALAQRLLADEKLTPNLVADLDRQWKVVDAAPTAAAEFAHVRNALAERLEAQVSLQRAMIDALAALRKHPDAGELERLAREHEDHLASPERGSLPRHLLNDFDATFAAERAVRQPAARAAPAAPAAPAVAPAPSAAAAAAAEPAGAKGADTAGQDHAAAAPAAGTATPPRSEALARADGHDPAAARQARPQKEKHKPSPAEQEANRHFMDMVEAMEAALSQGQLHIAAEHDKTLKDSKTGRLSPAQAERLAHVRADLKRLSDWARWGGNVSREELVHAVESLPAEGLGMSELAKKVGSMRERWKSLDGVSGAAPKSLWEKFDAACTAAYAPAAAHFRHLADERHANAAKAQQLVDEANALIARDTAQLEAAGGVQVDREESASGNLPHTHDWRTLASSTQRLRQAWSRLGTIDRKDKKRLDGAFNKAMDALMAPLDSQRKIEVARREQLIEEVGKLNPLERHTIDTLRRLQESWQGHARALPLERKTEQALWQKFRAACDQIFARRKEHAHAADHERKAHLHAREAICAGLESAAFEGDDKAVLAAIGKTLKEAAAAWHGAGVVPRASEQKIDQRYRAAVGALQSQADAIRKRAGAAQANALREKLRLVQALESALASALAEAGDIDSAGWSSQWQALPVLPAEQERTLRSRFEAALKAAGEGAAARAAYAGQLETNRQRLLSEVLRLEIVAGIDSGAEFAKDRLKMQVEVLQSSLKSGQKPASHAAQFLALCAMPALVDARTASRIEQLFRKIGAEGK